MKVVIFKILVIPSDLDFFLNSSNVNGDNIIKKCSRYFFYFLVRFNF